MTSLNIIFAGTPEFALPCLQALINAKHTIRAVYTQPDRPAGRGLKLQPSPVKQLALEHNLVVEQPQSLRESNAISKLKEYNPDVIIVVAYGLILPESVLALPRFGCINVHASLLPRWRGAAPIQRAILAGDKITGITIMQMDKGLDTGDILSQQVCPIESHDTSATLHQDLANLGGKLLIETLNDLVTGNIFPSAQDSAQATYATKISKEKAHIDWNLTASEIDRKIRAFNPRPIAFSYLDGANIRIWNCEMEKNPKITTESPIKPGTITEVSESGINVATANGVLRLLKIQLPGGKSLPVKEVLNARKSWLIPGKIFS